MIFHEFFLIFCSHAITTFTDAEKYFRAHTGKKIRMRKIMYEIKKHMRKIWTRMRYCHNPHAHQKELDLSDFFKSALEKKNTHVEKIIRMREFSVRMRFSVPC